MGKGKRREREASELYERAGYDTFRPQESKYGETDIFGLFDILAIRPDGAGPTRLVQVKANQPESISGWAADALAYSGTHRVVEMLVAYDGHGGPHPKPTRWRLIQPMDHGGPMDTEDVVDERDGGDAVVEYLESTV